MISSLPKRFLTRALGALLLTALAPVAQAAEPSPPPAVPECKPHVGSTPDLARADVYQGLPFQAGEEIRYTLKYGALKVHVGYGYLRVQAPAKQTINAVAADGKVVEESRWHRLFTAEAYTGDWYKYIFAAHDTLQSYSRPWDWGATKFYINQNEEKPFVRRYKAEKWLDFDHAKCVAKEKAVDHRKKKEKTGEHFLDPMAVDAMSAAYRLRTFDYKPNKTESFMVYTSEKNWMLQATPVAEETVKTAIGSFKAHKLDVKTYLGKDLQQRGKLFVWIAADHPNHPIIKIEGEVTFGSVYMEIDQYKAGGVASAPAPAAAPAAAPAPAAPAAEPAKK